MSDSPVTLDGLGLKRVINASATLTTLGGSIMPPEVVAAMVNGSRSFVDWPNLQRAVGRRIAELTNNEACYISSGAAAGSASAIHRAYRSGSACAIGPPRAADYRTGQPGPAFAAPAMVSSVSEMLPAANRLAMPAGIDPPGSVHT